MDTHALAAHASVIVDQVLLLTSKSNPTSSRQQWAQFVMTVHIVVEIPLMSSWREVVGGSRVSKPSVVVKIKWYVLHLHLSLRF